VDPRYGQILSQCDELSCQNERCLSSRNGQTRVLVQRTPKSQPHLSLCRYCQDTFYRSLAALNWHSTQSVDDEMRPGTAYTSVVNSTVHILARGLPHTCSYTCQPSRCSRSPFPVIDRYGRTLTFRTAYPRMALHHIIMAGRKLCDHAGPEPYRDCDKNWEAPRTPCVRRSSCCYRRRRQLQAFRCSLLGSRDCCTASLHNDLCQKSSPAPDSILVR
jgi:hypothetical protein